ncbi:putative DNA metabolism protein [Orbus hercynius]|uniref:Putative DNA metabolism protein n=1 Tax=Orbus hercynius TaxID=593135 RepID=A0A495RCX6_9GAMM|nr:TIGR03915 family putative DNA repair protein [Orbus hercynius]RKS85225.1 putative DNA metabolism protein [Orbus hercynius]
MIIFRYDDSFEGLLSAVFDAFTLKQWPQQILGPDEVQPLLSEHVHQVETTQEKYYRVSQAMEKRLSPVVLKQLTYVWFSQQIERATLIFNYLCKVFKSRQDITTNYADADILAIRKLAKKVSHERHYLMMFVRFNAIDNHGDKVYFATVTPRYDTLPLTVDFFQDRFADQKWAIFDTNRRYGYVYDLKQRHMMEIDEQSDLICDGHINDIYLGENEKQFQKMWYRYCQALTIKERINPKLQRQLMPVRFWQHLPETWHDSH